MSFLSEQPTDTIRSTGFIQGKFIDERLSRLSYMERDDFERYLEFCVAKTRTWLKSSAWPVHCRIPESE